MNFIISEIKNRIRKECKIALLLVFLSAIGIFCISVAVKLLQQTDEQKNRFLEVFEEVQFYSIADNFVGDMDYVDSDTEYTASFRLFYELLRNSEYFVYLPMYANPVYIDGYAGPEENVDDYEYGATIESSTFAFDAGDGTVVDSVCVKSCWMESNVITYFDLNVDEGRLFEESDYYFDPNENISIILGHNYAGTYDVGDVVNVRFVFSESPAVVVGFLEEGSNVFKTRSFVNLDNYVIMPLFRNDEYEGQYIYNLPINILYLFRTEGTIATKLTKDDIHSIINMYLDESGFGDMPQDAYYVVDYDQTEKIGFENGIKTLVFLIGLIVLSIIILVVVIEAIIMIKRTNLNKRYYAIMFLNGCTYRKMIGIVAAESLVSVTISLALSLILRLCFKLTIFEERTVTLIGAGMFFLLPVLIFVFMISDRKIIDYIRKNND